MPNIPVYTQKERQQTGEPVYQQYESAPPLMPIGAHEAETAASARLGSVIQDVAENLIKVQQHNEVLVGNSIRNQFKATANEILGGLQNEYRLEKAIPTQDNPGVYKVGTDVLNEKINEYVEAYTGSDVMKKALRQHLSNDVQPYLHALATYEKGQQSKLREANFAIAQNEALNSSYDDGVGIIKTAVADLYSGSPAIQTIAMDKFEKAYKQVESQATHQAIYDNLRNSATENGVVDYDKAISTLLTYEFQKENDIKPKDKDRLFNELKAEKAYVQSVNTEWANKQYNKELNGIAELQNKGDMRGAVNAVMNAKFIPESDKTQILHSIHTPLPEGKSNSNAYLEGIEKMYDTSIPLEDKKTWLLSNRGKFNITDFKHLGNIGMSQEKTNDKSAIIAGSKIITKALIDPKYKSRTQADRAQEAIDLYIKGVAENPGLNTPAKISAYAHEILKMPKFNSVNIMEDRMADLQKIQQKIAPALSQTGKKVVGYKEGKPVFDVGNGVWQVGD